MTVSLISITEYEKVHVGEPATTHLPNSVSASQAAVLGKLNQTYGFDVFKWVNQHTLAAQQYVGTVQLNGLTIEILPKIEGSGGTANNTTIRHNLVMMLMVVLDLELGEGDIAHISTQRHSILEVLIRLFCDKLFIQVRRGLVRRYEQRAENLNVLRGRLKINEQLRVNAANPERLFCNFDEFQEDNPLNQVLKAAVRLLLAVSRNLKNQRQLAELILVFEGVADMPRHSLPWQKVSFDRINERYRPSFKLAELFLKNTPPDVTGGRAQSYSLLFDMNNLFEEYIGRVAAKVFAPQGLHISRQGPRRYVAFDEKAQRDAFAMKPDVVGTKDGHSVWIIDTKWKQLSKEEAKEGVAQADLYQMYAYANCYACPDVVLLYPHHARLGQEVGERTRYRLKEWAPRLEQNEFARIRVATVDLTELRSIPNQLRQLFKRQLEEQITA